MNDFSNMSDEQLQSIASGSLRQSKTEAPQQDYSTMSDDQLQNIAMGGLRKALPKLQEAKGIGSTILDGVITVGKEIDSVTGAPTRKAIGALMDKENPLTAFAGQFGEDPDRAPTGKDLAKRIGFTDKPMSEDIPGLYSETGDEWLKFKKDGPMDWSPAGVAGFGVDVLADPTNLIPGKAVGAGLAKTASVGSDAIRMGTKGAAQAADFITGTKGATKTLEAAGKGIDAVGNVIDSATGAVRSAVNPKIADDFGRLSEVAKNNGIDPSLLPESVEFGQDTFLSRASRNVAEGPFGEKRLQSFNSGLDAVRGAVGNKIKKFTGGAEALDEVAAGSLLRDGYDRGVDNFFDKIDFSHNTIVNQVPGLALTEKSMSKIDSALGGVEKFAKGRVARGVTKAQREQGAQLLSAIDAIRSGSGSYKQTVEALRDIGDAAFKSTNTLADIPPDVQKLRKLYNDVSDGLIDTVRSELGDDIAKNLVDNNKAMSEFFGDKSLLAPIIGSKNMSPEQVFNSLVKNGDTSRLTALKKIMAPEDFSQLKGAFLENLIKRSPDGSFTFRGLHNGLRNKKNALSVLFEPDELSQITDLIELGDRFGDPVLSRSGTGASNFFRDLGTGIRDGIVSDNTVEMLKARARNGAGAAQSVAPPSASPKLSSQAPQAAGAAGLASIPIFENKLRAAAKGSQSVSTMEANEPPSSGMIAKVDANPEILKQIKNPTLKRNLIEAVNRKRQQRGDDVILESMGGAFNPKEKTSTNDAQSDFINSN